MTQHILEITTNVGDLSNQQKMMDRAIKSVGVEISRTLKETLKEILGGQLAEQTATNTIPVPGDDEYQDPSPLGPPPRSPATTSPPTTDPQTCTHNEATGPHGQSVHAAYPGTVTDEDPDPIPPPRQSPRQHITDEDPDPIPPPRQSPRQHNPVPLTSFAPEDSRSALDNSREYFSNPARGIPTNRYMSTPYRQSTYRPALGQNVRHQPQSTLHSHGFAPPPNVQTNYDFDGDDYDDIGKGGRITSPRHIDRRRDALKAKKSPLDIAALGNRAYHGDDDGYDRLTESIVHACGYDACISNTDVLQSYDEIILLHKDTRRQWVNLRSNNAGPQLDRIIEKGLATFPRLVSIDVESIIDFYDKFQQTSQLYLLPIIPFDCINMTMGYEGLCPPGLGLHKYARIGKVLLEVIPRILPKLNSQVTTLVTMVRIESGNGYDLLWRVLELGVPGFDPAIPVRIPTWNGDDIFEFANSFMLYYRLQAKKGVYHDDRTRSITFLNGIGSPVYSDAASTLRLNVHNYFSTEFDGYLPGHLCIMGLATQLHDSTVARRTNQLPSARRTMIQVPSLAIDSQPHPGQLVQGSPRVARVDGPRRWSEDPRDGDRRSENASVRFNDKDSTRRDRADPRRSYGDTDQRRVQNDRRPPPGRPSSDRPGSGRSIRPDRNRSSYLPNALCEACRRTGHVAATCDVLAMALLLEKYKRNMDDDSKDRLESAWIKRWQGTLGTDRKPRRVLRTYVDLLDITIDDLDEAICWDCWPDDDDTEDDTSVDVASA